MYTAPLPPAACMWPMGGHHRGLSGPSILYLDGGGRVHLGAPGKRRTLSKQAARQREHTAGMRMGHLLSNSWRSWRMSSTGVSNEMASRRFPSASITRVVAEWSTTYPTEEPGIRWLWT